MVECDRCGDDVSRRIEIRNAYFNNGVISQIRSKMVVCEPCHEDMQESDEWDV